MTHIDASPGPGDKTHDIALELNEDKYGLHVRGGIAGMQEQLATPTTIFKSTSEADFGDFDPEWSQIQQSDWTAGRGHEVARHNDRHYYHGQYIFTAAPNRMCQAPLWQWADGDYRDYNHVIPGSASFRPLVGSERYMAVSFTPGANYSVDKMYALIRKRGKPSALYGELWSDSSGPDAIISSFSANVDNDDVTDILSLWQAFDPTGTQAVTSGTTYWLVLYASITDDEGNHWEWAVNDSGSGGQVSSDGSTWSAGSFEPYYRAVDADDPVVWHFFELVDDSGDRHLFKISEPDSGNSALYIWDETNDEWDALSVGAGDALSNKVGGVVVMNNIAFFPRDNTENIWTLYDNGGTWTGNDLNVKADVLGVYTDKTEGPQLVRYINQSTWEYSKSDLPEAGSNPSFGTALAGPPGFDCLNMRFHNNQMYLRMTNGLYYVTNEAIVPAELGLGWITEKDDYPGPMLSRDNFLYLGWAFALERLFQGVLDDIGPHRFAGLPDGYQGIVSALAGDVAVTWFGIDGGSSNRSSVHGATERGEIHFPIWEAWEDGQRVRNLYLQAQDGTTNPRRLWISVGGDTVFIELPDNSLNPMKDSDQQYVWEGAIETSAYPIRWALPKIYDELAVTADNLGSTASIGVDYKLDDDVHSNDPEDWIVATEMYESPRDIASLKLGNAENISFRLRLMSKTVTTPVQVRATTLKAVAILPIKRRWAMQIEIGREKNNVGRPDHNAFELAEWLRTRAVSGWLLTLEAPDPNLNGIWVKVDNPVTLRDSINKLGTNMKGHVNLVLREV